MKPTIVLAAKAGVTLNGGDLSYYGGSNDTTFPSFQFGGSKGRLSYHVLGSYMQDNLGIENPTSGYNAIHDWTEQYKGFAKSTTLHAGYARYFTPPPLELVQSQTLKQFVGTSNQTATSQNSPVQPERANYFDAGMTEQFTRSFSVGVNGYYKISRNLIDEGQFGSALIFTPFNYARGNQYGAEVTANYSQGGFNASANFGFERGTGEQILSSQFPFEPDELAFTPRYTLTYFTAAVSQVALQTRTNCRVLSIESGLHAQHFICRTKRGRLGCASTLQTCPIRATNCETVPELGCSHRNSGHDVVFLAA
jgi:hypothetical protein